MWASPVNTSMGWKDWCEEEKFRDCDENNSFKFNLKDTANVIFINSSSDLESLPKEKITSPTTKIYLDFESLLNSGVDAVQVNLSNDHTEDWSERLYYKLYGWDCDSIIIMNPDIVCQI